MICDTVGLTVAEIKINEQAEEIGRLAFEIGCMKTELDAERKAKSLDIKLYAEWLNKMIESESTRPIGPDCTHIYKNCQKYFNLMVAK